MRKNQAKKRDVLPDPIYNSKLVTKAINMLMWDGKRWKAQDILYGAFKRIEEKTKKPAMDVFNQALENIMPTLSFIKNSIKHWETSVNIFPICLKYFLWHLAKYVFCWFFIFCKLDQSQYSCNQQICSHMLYKMLHFLVECNMNLIVLNMT